MLIVIFIATLTNINLVIHMCTQILFIVIIRREFAFIVSCFPLRVNLNTVHWTQRVVLLPVVCYQFSFEVRTLNFTQICRLCIRPIEAIIIFVEIWYDKMRNLPNSLRLILNFNRLLSRINISIRFPDQPKQLSAFIVINEFTTNILDSCIAFN